MRLPKCSGHLEHADQSQAATGELAELAELAESLEQRPLEAKLEDAKEVSQPKMLQEDCRAGWAPAESDRG